ncbi:putative adhesin [Streptomyces sp. NPDC055085]
MSQLKELTDLLGQAAAAGGSSEAILSAAVIRALSRWITSKKDFSYDSAADVLAAARSSVKPLPPIPSGKEAKQPPAAPARSSVIPLPPIPSGKETKQPPAVLDQAGRDNDWAAEASGAVHRWDGTPRSGDVYVLSHGEYLGGTTFVPQGIRLQFYAEHGETVSSGSTALLLRGVEVPVPAPYLSSQLVSNYALTPHSDEDLIDYLPLLEQLPDSEALCIGQSALRNAGALCSMMDACMAEFLDTGIARHLDDCEGLLGPRNTQYLAATTHLLSCRAHPLIDKSDQAEEIMNDILYALMRKRSGYSGSLPIPNKIQAEFWEELTLDDIDALPHKERIVVIGRSNPTIAAYARREGITPIGRRSDPREMRRALTRLEETVKRLRAEAESRSASDREAACKDAVAAASAAADRLTPRTALSREQERIIAEEVSQAQQTVCDMIVKSSDHILGTAKTLREKIDAHALTLTEIKDRPPAPSSAAVPAEPPAAPAARPAPAREAKSAPAPDPLAGFSIARQQLLAELGALEEELTRKYPPRPTPDAPKPLPTLRTSAMYRRWRELHTACRAFLTNDAIAQASAKDGTFEHIANRPGPAQ